MSNMMNIPAPTNINQSCGLPLGAPDQQQLGRHIGGQVEEFPAGVRALQRGRKFQPDLGPQLPQCYNQSSTTYNHHFYFDQVKLTFT